MRGGGWVLALALVLALAPAAHAATPSFDCTRARTWAEHTICGDEELATLDRALAAAFAQRKAASTEAGRKTLVTVQRRWMAARDDCRRADAPRLCLVERYRARLAELGGTTPAGAGGAAPTGPATAPAPAAPQRRGALAECWAGAASRPEVGPCLERKLVEARAAFDEADARVERALEARDAATSAAPALPAFRAAQQAFLAFRDANCRWQGAMLEPGTGAGQAEQACLVDYTRARTAEITALAPPAAR